MTGFRKDLVHGPRDQGGRSLSRCQGVVVLAVNDKRRNLHRSEARGHVRSAPGTKNLADGFAGQPRVSFHKSVEQIFSQSRLGKIRSDQLPEVLNVILLDANLGVAVMRSSMLPAPPLLPPTRISALNIAG